MTHRRRTHAHRLSKAPFIGAKAVSHTSFTLFISCRSRSTVSRMTPTATSSVNSAWPVRTVRGLYWPRENTLTRRAHVRLVKSYHVEPLWQQTQRSRATWRTIWCRQNYCTTRPDHSSDPQSLPPRPAARQHKDQQASSNVKSTTVPHDLLVLTALSNTGATRYV